MTRDQVGILLPLPIAAPFDYRVPVGMTLAAGDWVEVPFGPRQMRGVVWRGPGETATAPGAAPTGTIDPEKLKSVAHHFDIPPLSMATRRFVDWVANYTLSPPGSVLRMVMRAGDGLSTPRAIPAVQRVTPAPSAIRMTPKREQVLAACGAAPMAIKTLSEKSGASAAVIRGLVTASALMPVSLDPDAPFTPPDLARSGKDLSSAQAGAVAEIAERLSPTAPGQNDLAPKPILIDGVTGSGKTEVYLEAARLALAKDSAAQVLILLPEIGLTLPFLNRIEARFGAAPAAWHSDIPAAARRRVWRRVLDGQVRLVVGARSALFLPFQNLQMIIVDEEHDPAYKQEDGVLYHGRDMAVARGSLDRIPIVLASATPALETMVNALDDRYHRLTLTQRFGAATLPTIDLIDLRETPPSISNDNQHQDKTTSSMRQPSWIAPPLADAISETLVRHEQTLLFLNRRGYAPLTICRKCGHRMMAPDSDTCLVEHRFENRLICHHTGYSIAKPKACPQCNAIDSLAACGPGVERIADEVRRRWPHAHTEILSSDRTQGAGTAKALLEAMRAGEIDILVATQAAAKGHNFPGLTLVGVVDADMGLSGGDLRAAERTYQLLAQVAGRAGRADKPGRALIQTHQPAAPVLQALIDGDRDRFLAIEAEGRMAMLFPPFGRLAAILLRGKNENQVRTAAQNLRQAAPRTDGIEIWGPAPAPLYRLNGEVRMRMLVRARRDLNLQAYLRDWTGALKMPGAVRRTIDIDPYSFM
ncbi:MAG: primosomal protein N' [Pseudomonadota bacterium]